MGEQVAAGLKKRITKQPIDGGIAQMGEHLPCKQGVKGSNPFISRVVMRSDYKSNCTLKTEYRIKKSDIKVCKRTR